MKKKNASVLHIDIKKEAMSIPKLVRQLGKELSISNTILIGQRKFVIIGIIPIIPLIFSLIFKQILCTVIFGITWLIVWAVIWIPYRNSLLETHQISRNPDEVLLVLRKRKLKAALCSLGFKSEESVEVLFEKIKYFAEKEQDPFEGFGFLISSFGSVAITLFAVAVQMDLKNIDQVKSLFFVLLKMFLVVLGIFLVLMVIAREIYRRLFFKNKVDAELILSILNDII